MHVFSPPTTAAPTTTAPPPPMVSVSIATSGTNTTGETYSLVCSVTVTGSTDTPTITWLDPMNSQVPSEMVSTTGSMSTLAFNPLSASHAGTYTCRATLTSGEMGTDTEIVTVQSEHRNIVLLVYLKQHFVYFQPPPSLSELMLV